MFKEAQNLFSKNPISPTRTLQLSSSWPHFEHNPSPFENSPFRCCRRRSDRSRRFPRGRPSAAGPSARGRPHRAPPGGGPVLQVKRRRGAKRWPLETACPVRIFPWDGLDSWCPVMLWLGRWCRCWIILSDRRRDVNRRPEDNARRFQNGVHLNAYWKERVFVASRLPPLVWRRRRHSRRRY